MYCNDPGCIPLRKDWQRGSDAPSFPRRSVRRDGYRIRHHCRRHRSTAIIATVYRYRAKAQQARFRPSRRSSNRPPATMRTCSFLPSQSAYLPRSMLFSSRVKTAPHSGENCKTKQCSTIAQRHRQLGDVGCNAGRLSSANDWPVMRILFRCFRPAPPFVLLKERSIVVEADASRSP